MRLITSALFSCLLLAAGQTSAQVQSISGDEFAASRKYCDAKWQALTAENAAVGQNHDKFTRTCVCDRRWQEKVAARIGDQKSREKDRRRCLGYLTDGNGLAYAAYSDVPEFAFFGGSTLILSLIGLTASDGQTNGTPVSP
jgi:hypothetical protein